MYCIGGPKIVIQPSAKPTPQPNPPTRQATTLLKDGVDTYLTSTPAQQKQILEVLKDGKKKLQAIKAGTYQTAP